MKRACPLCRKVAVKEGNKFWPLCGERCHLIDLGKWLGEEYRVSAEPDESATEEAAAAASVVDPDADAC